MRRPGRTANIPFRKRPRALPALLLPMLLAACDDPAPPPAPEIRPVRVVTVAPRSGGDSVSITGTVAAETEVNLAFRIDGRMVERLVNVGDRVTAGQLVARLDRQNEENSLRAARAQASRRPRPADRGAQQLPAPARAAADRLHHPRPLRRGDAHPARGRQSAARRRPGPGQHRREPARLYRAARRCRRHGHRPRRRAGRGGAGRADDRPARAARTAATRCSTCRRRR